MKLSKEVIEYASQLGWEALPVGWDNYYEPINDESDIEVFIREDDEPEYWYGTPIPGTQGYEYITPEEMLERYNYYILCEDASTPGNL